MQDKKGIGSSQQGITKGKSCLTNLAAFCREIMIPEDKGRAVAVVSLDFRKALIWSPCGILMGRLVRYGLGKCGL